MNQTRFYTLIIVIYYGVTLHVAVIFAYIFSRGRNVKKTME